MIGQVLDEKYRIEKQLGKGGMGAVYFATHLGTERPVALKVIVPQFMCNDEFIERFKREAKAAGRLRHPNVVDVTDFGFARVGADRVAYLVMEYLDGCTLAEVLAEEPRLPLDWVVDILDQACSAIEEAHRQNIIHRDLKPDNIWLEPNRRGGYTVKVLDFGLAKLADTMASGPALEERPSEAVAPTSLPDLARRLGGEPPDLASPARSFAAHPAELSEAVTQVQPSAFSEAPTQLEQASAPGEEETQILTERAREEGRPQSVEEETALIEEAERTRRLDQRTNPQQQGARTASQEGLTRVGSILGTPLYMSPEQCRGERLDARSDIYSLGVIAYRMLSGEPPFTGDLGQVMKHHMEAAPPPLLEKNPKLPKRVARLIMSTLAKDPAERPPSAEGFASALHANSEGAGTIFRKAIALYSERFPTFIRLSLIAHIPLLAMAALMTINLGLGALMIIPSGPISVAMVAIVTLINFIVTPVIVAVTARLVTQLIVAPLRPLEIRPAFAALRKQTGPFLKTVALASLLILLGFALLIIPGLIFIINYSLYVPVMMVEGKFGRAALKRSKELVKRVRPTVIMIVFIQFVIPTLTKTVTGLAVQVTARMFRMSPDPMIQGTIAELIRMLLFVVITPFIAVMISLLYLKTRQAGGETLKEAIGQFDEDVMPRSNWQLRMRERTHIHSHPSR